MQPTTVILCCVVLLMAVCCQDTAAQFVQCRGAEACVNIEDCPTFGPHYHEPAKWTDALRQEFRKRVCKRERINGGNAYKVCCQPANDGRKRGLELLDLESCGPYTEDRIAFGQDARLFQFPWMALLMTRDNRFPCGGTLIAERYVLSAAHCVLERIVKVRLGEFDISKPIDCDKRGELCAEAPQDIPVEKTISHEDYSRRYKVNDIALFRLARNAELNDNVAPICLPVNAAMSTKQPVYFVAGWGTTEKDITSDRLLFTKLSLVPNAECKERLKPHEQDIQLYDTQMCAMGTNLTDNCTGDSGGPLKTISINARYVQYGVVSYGLRSCGRLSAPGVYARVESYVPWILQHLEE
uniref:Peptidase S1 domain-containing protein n=1 Tax=Anopheles farauti TaxID=69004 RepID=A0A182Q1X5_9DIPT